MSEPEVEVDINDDGGDDIAEPSIIRRILKLKDVQDEVDAIDQEYREERLILEQKYREKKSPYFVKRTDYILGKCDLEGEPNAASESDEGPAEGDTIPMFWLKAMMNHDVLQDAIQEADFGALACLQDITVAYNENMDGYALHFHFCENEWFENETLMKKYHGLDLIMGEEADEQEIESSQIQWKEGKNLLVKSKKVKQRSKGGKNKGEVRYVQRDVPVPSFFYYFSDPVEPLDDEDEEDTRPQFDYDQDFEIGESVRLNIIPNAINWFTGEAADSEEEEEEEDEEGDEGEEGDLDDDDDSSTENPNETQKAEGVAPASGEQGECKQS